LCNWLELVTPYGITPSVTALFPRRGNTLCRCAPPLFRRRRNRASPYGAWAASGYLPSEQTPLFARRANRASAFGAWGRPYDDRKRSSRVCNPLWGLGLAPKALGVYKPPIIGQRFACAGLTSGAWQLPLRGFKNPEGF
jgi:hypothetical protein